jgi:hypothetical protein
VPAPQPGPAELTTRRAALVALAAALDPREFATTLHVPPVRSELIYNKDDHQVTIYATITPATPDTLAAIIATSEPPAAPATADLAGLGHSPQHPRMWVECPSPHTRPIRTGTPPVRQGQGQ